MENGITGLVQAGYDAALSTLKKYNVQHHANTLAQTAMLSFGSVATGNITTAKNKMLNIYNNLINAGFTNKLLFDSGGFQVLMGYVPQNDVPIMIDQYIEFIKETINNNNYYMSLDIMPNGKTITDEEAAFKLSSLFINRAADLPEKVRDHIYIVYHFTSPSMLSIWDRLLNKPNVSELIGSHKWAFGGLATREPKRKTGSLVVFIYPLIDVIFNNEWEYLGQNTLYFHTLGVTSPFENVTGYIIAELLNIGGYSVGYSYDSSSAIQQVTRATTLNVFSEETGIQDIRFNVSNKNHQLTNDATVDEFITDLLNKFIKEYGINRAPFKSIYNNNRVDSEALQLLVLVQIDQMNKLTKFIQHSSKELAQTYTKSLVNFNTDLLDFMCVLHNNKLNNQLLKLNHKVVNSITTFMSYMEAPKSYNHKKFITELMNIFQRFEKTTKFDSMNVKFWED